MDVNEKPKCCVCERPFEPRADKGVAGRIYCSARCAWNTSASRSTESLQREADALKAALEWS